MKGPTSAGSGLGRLAALRQTLGTSRAGRWRGGRFTPGVNDGGRGGGVRDDTRPSTHGRSTGAEGGPAQISRRRCRGWYSGGPRCAGESGQGRGFFPLPAGGCRCGGVAEKEAGRRGERVGRGAETTRARRRRMLGSARAANAARGAGDPRQHGPAGAGHLGPRCRCPSGAGQVDSRSGGRQAGLLVYPGVNRRAGPDEPKGAGHAASKREAGRRG